MPSLRTLRVLCLGVVAFPLVAAPSAAAMQHPAPAPGRTGALDAHRVVVAPAETLGVQVGPTAGPPVVIVPGIFTSAFAFRHIAPMLIEAGFRPVIIEPLTIGASSRPPEADYTLTAQGRRIGMVMDSLDIGRALFLTQGIASSMALRLAIERPALVGGIVSLDGGAGEAAVTPGLREALPVARWVLRVPGGSWLVRRRLKGDFRSLSGDASWMTDEVLDGYLAPLEGRLSETLAAFDRMSRSEEPARLAPRLPMVQCPVHVLVGLVPHEGVVPDAEKAAMEAGLGRLEFHYIEGVGHLIHEERPDEVVRAVKRMHVAAGEALIRP